MSDGPLLNDVTRAFAEAHRNEDVRDLALKTKRTADLDLPAAMQRRQSADEYVTSVPVIREPHTCSFPHPWITLWISEVKPVGKSGITWWIIHKDIHKMAEHEEFPM